MTEEQFIEITKWQDETFPDATYLSKLHHLELEFMELREALENKFKNKFEVSLEFADCFLLLFGAAKKFGMDYEDICNAIEDKMNVNRHREWGKPDENGVVNHLK